MNRFEKVSIATYAKAEYINIDEMSKEAFDEVMEDITSLLSKLDLPTRATQFSAGYDFVSPLTYRIEPNEIIKIPTGIKVKLDYNKFLDVRIRSSMGFENKFRLINQAGVIDVDYYNNPDNEGHIFIGLQNISGSVLFIEQGEKIAQGIISEYFITIDDAAEDIRDGGVGSTGK